MTLAYVVHYFFAVILQPADLVPLAYITYKWLQDSTEEL
jgi:hypothetical protein